jgi:hypothetical protein
MDLRERGLAFIASLDSRVSSVQLYASGYQGFNQFDGELLKA